ncbi:TetR family transcriptional regulator [Austwickia chelonae]|uniref:acyl-CoA-like ligand-binding transcription factor n=1 Tax=Austwickia chelonae TaxID=100225 RepID=UPI000E23C91C|nr:TetR family transcriptional regulator [Austwickia chelonae]
MSDGSLRERKKRETRLRLHHAALELAARDGLNAVTAGAIAEHAGVSPRTFFNYFPTKDAAIIGTDPELPQQLAAAFEERPAEEDPRNSLRHILTAHLVSVAAAPALRHQRNRLMATHPELAGTLGGISRQVQEALAEAVARRSGGDPAHDPYPQLTVAVALAAVSTALARRRARTNGPDDMQADLDIVFDLLEAGIPAPSGRPARTPHTS